MACWPACRLEPGVRVHDAPLTRLHRRIADRGGHLFGGLAVGVRDDRVHHVPVVREAPHETAREARFEFPIHGELEIQLMAHREQGDRRLERSRRVNRLIGITRTKTDRIKARVDRCTRDRGSPRLESTE